MLLHFLAGKCCVASWSIRSFILLRNQPSKKWLIILFIFCLHKDSVELSCLVFKCIVSSLSSLRVGYSKWIIWMPRVSLPFIDISNGPSCPEWGVVRKNFGKGQELPGWGADCLTQHQGRKWESGRRGGRKKPASAVAQLRECSRQGCRRSHIPRRKRMRAGEPDRPGFGSQPHQLPALWTWTSYLITWALAPLPLKPG